MSPHYFFPVPGSGALRTAATGADPALERIENLPAGALERQLAHGEALGRVVIRSDFVPVLRAVFDELAPRQSPIEQLLYLHLYRHSYGEDRNHCRLARRELGHVTGLSPRRFNRALAGLVRKGHVRPLQRDRRGTLYRVLLPQEILSGRVGDEVLLGRLRAASEALPGVKASGAGAGLQGTADGPGAPSTAGGTSPHSAAVSKEAQVTAAGAGAPDTGSPAARAGSAARPAVPGRRSRASTKRHHKMTSIGDRARPPSPGPSVGVTAPPSVGELVEALLARLPPRRRAAAAQDALQDVLELLEEGHPPALLAARLGELQPGGGSADLVRLLRGEAASAGGRRVREPDAGPREARAPRDRGAAPGT